MVRLNDQVELIFVVQNQFNAKGGRFTKMIDLNQIEDGKFNISRVLSQIMASQGLPLLNSLIFFVDQRKKIKVFIGTFTGNDILLQKQNIQNQTIQIQYKDAQSQSICYPTSLSSRKTKERTIKQAMTSVNKWLKMYNERNQKGERTNTLQNAAKIIGMSKKTLSDYYKLIKTAEQYQFDFDMHDNDKVGVLRGFIRLKTIQMKRKMSQQTFTEPDLFWSLGFENQKLYS